jgi:hypothetical protein
MGRLLWAYTQFLLRATNIAGKSRCAKGEFTEILGESAVSMCPRWGECRDHGTGEWLVDARQNDCAPDLNAFQRNSVAARRATRHYPPLASVLVGRRNATES